MLQIPTWSRILTALVVAMGLLIALPNALPDRALARLPAWLPHDTVSLGLDLQGGSYLLLQVDFDQVQKDKTEALVGDIRAAFRKAHIPYTDLDAKADGVQVRVTDSTRLDEAAKLIDGLNGSMQSSILAVGAKEYDVTQPGGGLFVMHTTDGYKTQTRTQVMEQSIEVVRRRIDEMGTREPTVTPSGEDRILVEIADNVQVKVLKATLSDVRAKTQPANEA